MNTPGQNANAVAELAIGLMIGVERGWEEREAAEGARVAGVRTYGLIGLLGGGAALVSGQLGALVAGLAFIGVSGMMIVVYVANLRTHDDIGITSVVAALLAFILGALAATGEVGIAAAAGKGESGLSGFGIVTMASLFPILGVMLLALRHPMVAARQIATFAESIFTVSRISLMIPRRDLAEISTFFR